MIKGSFTTGVKFLQDARIFLDNEFNERFVPLKDFICCVHDNYVQQCLFHLRRLRGQFSEGVFVGILKFFESM